MKRLLIITVFFVCSLMQASAKPILSFFNEQKTPELVQMFSDTTLIPTLQKLQAEIRMGMLDLTPERAAIVKQLNEAGIPVVAWLLLPEEKGYWFHAGNGDQAIQRYIETRNWVSANGLKLKGIGIDLELDMNDVTLIKQSPRRAAWKFFKRLYSTETLEEGRRKYSQLLAMIKNDGYMVESYYASFVKDETAMNRTALQQLSGFLDIKTEREIPMLYSSFIGSPDGLYKIWGMDVGAKYVGLGSTGGGVDPSLPSLSYSQMVHDLNIASKFAEEIHIFSLEGCVDKGYLVKLLGYQYDPSLTLNENQVKRAKKIQGYFKFASKVLSYPTILLIGVLLGMAVVGFFFYLLIRTLVRLALRLIR